MYRHLKRYLDVLVNQGIPMTGSLFKMLKRSVASNDYTAEFDDKPIGINTLSSIPKKVTQRSKGGRPQTFLTISKTSLCHFLY